MIDEEALRRLVDEAGESVTPTYRDRVERYGPDAARAVLKVYTELEALVSGDRPTPPAI